MLPQRKQIRLRYVDYAATGAYYVTLCSHNKACIFSTIERSDGASLSSIIAQVKSIVTKRAKKELGLNDEIWQRNFYEHIIRNEKDMNRIKEYIQTNPITWHYDHENPEAP